MEILQIIVVVLQGAAISLGMGASTLAIANFFVAIADGKIEGDERKMMGVVYAVLRVAMVLIFSTTILLFLSSVMSSGLAGVSAFILAQLIITFVLFTNAWLMTKRVMPSSIGPALQAGSWYTLGIMSTLVGMVGVTVVLGMFALWYCAAIVVALVTVNGVMAYLKK